MIRLFNSQIACGAALLLIAPVAHAQDGRFVGDYVHSERELVAGIRLSDDGTFLYGLTVGSLDEQAKGRWKVADGRVELNSDPRPVAPTVESGKVELAPGQPFALRLLAPDGRDVPGIDFVLEFGAGEPIESYMAGSPWQLPANEPRVPRFVTFNEPSYRLHSPRLALEGKTGTVATFLLQPNDFGVADLTGTTAELAGDTLTLHRPEGRMTFKREKR